MVALSVGAMGALSVGLMSAGLLSVGLLSVAALVAFSGCIGAVKVLYSVVRR